MFLPFLVLSFIFASLYVIMNVAMVLVFARAINALAGQAQDILDAARASELQALGLKSIVFSIGNVLLYVALWCFMGVYPVNLRLPEVSKEGNGGLISEIIKRRGTACALR